MYTQTQFFSRRENKKKDYNLRRWLLGKKWNVMSSWCKLSNDWTEPGLELDKKRCQCGTVSFPPPLLTLSALHFPPLRLCPFPVLGSPPPNLARGSKESCELPGPADIRWALLQKNSDNQVYALWPVLALRHTSMVFLRKVAVWFRAYQGSADVALPYFPLPALSRTCWWYMVFVSERTGINEWVYAHSSRLKTHALIALQTNKKFRSESLGSQCIK